MGDQLLSYLLLVVLVGASAFFSGTEVAMFGLRRVDREQLAKSQRPRDSLILRMLAKPRRLIATLLIGNEIVNVSISVVIATVFTSALPAELSDLQRTVVATAISATILLLIGEITPKTIAIKMPIGWARKAVRPLWLFGWLVAPVRVLIRGVADQLMRVFGAKGASLGPQDMGELEYRALVDAGSAHGELDPRERRLIHRVFEFDDKTVDQVMRPRKRIFALAYDLPTPRLISEIAASGFSRVPIYQKSLDRIRGVVYAKDLVIQGTGLSAPRKLSELLHEPLFIPQSISIEQLFRTFKQRKTHIAIVVNEYGKVLGLVTMEDLLEELFGEILDEREQQKAQSERSSLGVVPGGRVGTAPGSGRRKRAGS